MRNRPKDKRINSLRTVAYQIWVESNHVRVEILTCSGWRVATAQKECAPRLWNVAIIATRACFTFNGASVPLNALLMLTVWGKRIEAIQIDANRFENDKFNGIDEDIYELQLILMNLYETLNKCHNRGSNQTREQKCTNKQIQRNIAQEPGWLTNW